MHEKHHIMCHICHEPQCLGRECIFLADRKEISRSIQKITPGNKKIVPVNKNPIPVPKTIPPENKILARVMKSFINFDYLPASFRRKKALPPPVMVPARKHVVCYLCAEPQCLDEECIFITDPEDFTRGMKNFIHFRYVPLSTGNPVGTKLKTLYIHAVKMFWFAVVLVTVIYVLIMGGLHLVSSTFSTLQSEVPLQFYIAVYAVGVTVVCLVLANLFGSDSETA